MNLIETNMARCAYWMGRARSLASLDEGNEPICELIDRAYDCLVGGTESIMYETKEEI